VDSFVGAGQIEEAGLEPNPEDFEALYDDLATSGQHDTVIVEIESRVRDYFTHLELPPTATVYDYLLLSLRPKDLIATFNWDPLLVQAFRRHAGFISMPQLAFLHGNVAVGFCDTHQKCGWHDERCPVCKKLFSPSSLLFPVRNKDYKAQPFIRSQWALLEDLLEEAYFFTIFGYRAPTTDAAARSLLLRVWSKNRTREIAEIEMIDTRSAEDLRRTWEDFIVRSHSITGDDVMRSYTSWHPRRSCDALFAATMRNDPWGDDRLPKFEDPVELRAWVEPLWREESHLRGSGQQFSGRPCREWHDESSK